MAAIRTEHFAEGATPYLDGRICLHAGDCLDVLRTIPDASVDSIVTDPPYALASIVRRFGGANAAPAKGDVYARASRGFMGKAWDTGDRAFSVEFWAEALRVLKPGGHVVAFGGTRTYHRLACAIEDAGFEIRDLIAWMYGSGFPKSHNQAGEWAGWGTALKPAIEPIVFARKPLIGTVAANLAQHGVGALNIDACRVATEDDLRAGAGVLWSHQRAGEASAERRYTDKGSTNFAAKPGPRGGSPAGRWPANVVHDGSDEVVSAFPDAPGQIAAVGPRHGAKNSVNVYGDFGARDEFTPRGDTGSAARFFYSAKADADDRIGSKHPTVKPVDLMRWIVRLVTPPGGIVLDPFAGTGTTGEAAYREGFSAVLIEREEEYRADIARRMALVLAGPDEKRHAILKARGKVEAPGGLFAFLGDAAE
jgi:site-specific DNA-methyltransferase (adenine-specific)